MTKRREGQGRGRRARLLISMLLTVALPACTTETIQKIVKTVESDGPSAEALAAEKSMTPPARDPEHVRLLIAGDTHFIWGVTDLQKEKGLRYPTERLEGLFHAADFRILNLETALSEKGEPISKKAFIFNAPPASIELLSALRLDLALLGNNHAMDMGHAGLDDTIQRLRRAGIATVGAGDNARTAAAPYYFELDGIKFAVLSYSDIGTPEIFSTFSRPGVASARNNPYFAVKKFARGVDHLLVSLHWGIEYYTKPTPEQVKIARALIDAGASAVIGHHPHIPQGIEVYRGGIICYSLGNFLFGSVNPYQTENLVVRLDVRRGDRRLRRAELYPIHGAYRKSGHGLRMLTAEETRPFWQEFYLQSTDLNGDFKQRFRISEAGVGQVLIAED